MGFIEIGPGIMHTFDELRFFWCFFFFVEIFEQSCSCISCNVLYIAVAYDSIRS